MRYSALLLFVGLAGTGCPNDPSNPNVLWLALDGSETNVRLIASEPQPF